VANPSALGDQTGRFGDRAGENDVEAVQIVEDETKGLDDGLLPVLSGLLDDQSELLSPRAGGLALTARCAFDGRRHHHQKMVANWKPIM
jgi:hypothetical protein